MLVIAGRITLDPKNQEKAIEAAVEMMKETRKEPGCKSYVFSAELGEPGAFRLFEEWESEEALRAHFEAPHMKRFQAAMGAFGVTGMSVQKYQISSVGPIR
jgi:quinol monooxygenase YgiN